MKNLTKLGRFTVSRRVLSTPIMEVYEAIDSTSRCSVLLQVPSRDFDGLHCLSAASRSALGGCTALPEILEEAVEDLQPYVVLRAFPATSLSERISAGPLTASESLRILKPLAEQLDMLHSSQSVLVTLRPELVFLTEDGDLKLFNLALPSADQDHLLQEMIPAEELLESILYLAPEVICDRAPGPEGDQFSLAVIAYQLITGELPFPVKSPLSRMMECLAEQSNNISVSQVTSQLQTVFRRALSCRPVARFSSCTAMVKSLEQPLNVRMPAAQTRLSSVDDMADDSRSGISSFSVPKLAEVIAERSNGSKRSLSTSKLIISFSVSLALCATLAFFAVYWWQRQPHAEPARLNLQRTEAPGSREVTPEVLQLPVKSPDEKMQQPNSTAKPADNRPATPKAATRGATLRKTK